ncbi:MAG: HEAT repeat domain-containing protein [Cyanobacteria bacterium P01_D01_bin.1]
MSSASPPERTPKQTPEQIRPMISSENFGDRIKGINLLRNIKPDTAFELIQPLCKDSNTRVRYAAVSQISTLGKQDLDTALDLLKQALADPEPDVQAAAADSIGALKLSEAFSDLQTLYQTTPEWLVKMSIVACLGEMGDPRAFDLLQTALNEGNSLVLVSAIGALGELKDERAIPLLLPYVDSDDWQIRHRLAQALGHFSHRSDVQAALETLSSDKSDVVAETARSHQTAE